MAMLARRPWPHLGSTWQFAESGRGVAVSWWVWLLLAVGLVVVAVIAMSLRDVNRYRRICRM